MAKADKFRFRRLDSIGAADAEEDKSFLDECFIDTGDLQALRDCRNPRRLVLGRTGSGKSAVLFKLAEAEERSISVRPESLALAYISNSTILQFLSELDVKLDIFFRLLWRHVFTVEILKAHFRIEDEQDKRSFIDKIHNLFRDKKHLRAVEYLEDWGKSFWEETEYRIKELTTTLEKNLKAAVQGGLGDISLTAEGAQKLSQEQKKEVVQRAQHVVNQVQIRQLSDIIELIDDVLADQQKRYFILIDRLDEDWIEEKLRFRLIRALIETVKDFGRIHHAKIVVAIRLDLLDRVFRLTRDAGFQEEKYESLYLPLQWTRSQLTEVLDMRINRLVQPRYSKQKVTHADILPHKIDDQPTIEFMLARTMMRPRDLILFFNACIRLATDRPQITVQMIREAEGEYSRDRLRSLADEWIADYPNLIEFAMLLRGQTQQFGLRDVSSEECGNFCLEAVIRGMEKSDIFSIAANQLVNCEIDYREFKKTIFQIFYRVGLTGLKPTGSGSDSFSWSTIGRTSISRPEISEATRVSIHPAFWRVLGARPLRG